MVDMKPRKNFPLKKKYNAEEFFEFVKNKPENERYELIDGRIYMMAAPNISHQRLILSIGSKLSDYLDGKKCEVFISPLDVVLFKKDKKDKSQNVFQPDVFVVCDPKKITDKRIYGAPDFIVEVVSPSSETHDYFKKLQIYFKYGVKEYWIVNPAKREITVYCNVNEEEYKTYTFSDKIKVGIFDDFEIDFAKLQI